MISAKNLIAKLYMIRAKNLIAKLQKDISLKKNAKLRGELCNLRIINLNDKQLKEILELLQKTGLSNAIIQLELTQNKLSTLPSEIGQLTALKKLDLCSNQLSTLPLEIWQLMALQELNLAWNLLTILPSEIERLEALQTLVLCNNQLSTLPPEIGRLTMLEKLNLGNNQLSILPAEIGRLTMLKELNLYHNQLITLAGEIGRLTMLKELNLDNNQLSILPPEIGGLMALQRLELCDNQLSTLPPEIGRLTMLKELDLENNQLSILPPEIAGLTALQKLELCGNQLSTLPLTLGALNNCEFVAWENPLSAGTLQTTENLRAAWISLQDLCRRDLEIKAAFVGKVLGLKKERLQLPEGLGHHISKFAINPDLLEQLRKLSSGEREILEESVDPNAKAANELKAVHRFLFKAIADNNVESLKKILSDKSIRVNLNRTVMVEGGRSTLLHAAVLNKASSELTRLLLAAGADPNVMDSNGRTPVALAVLEGRDDILAIYQLVRDKITDDTWARAVNSYLAIVDNPEIDRKEVKNILDTVSAQKKIPQRKLSEAIHASNQNVVKNILTNNNNLDLNASGEGALLLFHATAQNTPKIVSFLVEAGIDPNVTIVDDRGQLTTAVHRATKEGLKEVLQAYSDSGKVRLETWENVEAMLKSLFASGQTNARHDEYKEIREVIRLAKEKTLTTSKVTQTQVPAVTFHFQAVPKREPNRPAPKVFVPRRPRIAIE